MQKSKKQKHHSPLWPWHREVLPNGMTLVIKEVHSAPIAAVDIWAGTGAGDESTENNGISHFLEHMFFKGTPRFPVGQMDREVKSLGGYNNAATSLDFTHYYIVVPSTHTVKALDLLSDAYMNMSLPPDEIELERKVVLEEIHRKEDSPTGKLFTDFLTQIFSGTPYEMEVLGSEESLARINRASFLEYKRRRYSPARTTLVIAGDVDTEKIRDEAWNFFSGFKQESDCCEQIFAVKPSADPKEFTIRKEVQQSYLVIGFATPPIAGTKDEFALEIASTILGEGTSSRLHRILQEKKKIVSEIQSFSEVYRRGGVFAVYSSFDDEKLDTVRRETWSLLDRAIEDPIPEAELEKAKTMICTDFAFSSERVSEIANTLGDFETNFQIEDAAKYMEHIQAVTAKQVTDVLRKYCRREAAVTGILRPNGKAKR